MNRTLAAALVFGATASALALTQERFRYTDRLKNIVVLATDASMDDVNGKTTKLNLKGKVDITSVSQGLHLTAEQVICTVEAAEGKSAPTKKELRTATAKGGLHVTKSVSNANGRQTTDIKGSEGQIDAKPTGSVVSLKGPVRLENLDERKRSTMSATGSSCVATLEPGDKSKVSSGLVGATLQGPVTMNLIQSAEAGTTGEARAVGTADRMEIARAGAGSTVRLIGHVEIHGTGNSRIGTATGLSAAIFELNSSGEVKRFTMKAGAGSPMLFASIGGGFQTQETVTVLEGANGVIRLKGYSSLVSDLETGETVLEGNGGAIVVEDTGSGMTLKAKRMNCTLRKNGLGQSLVMKAKLTGDADVSFDSDIAQRTAEERAKASGKSFAPKDRHNTDVVRSEDIDYVREGANATLTLAHPFNWKDHSVGVEPNLAPSVLDCLVEGNTGVIKFAWGSEGPPPIQLDPQSVNVEGAVHFHIDRAVGAIASAKATKTSYDATGKTFVALFGALAPNGAGTITLAGDITLRKETDGQADTFVGSRAVVTLKGPSTLVPAKYQVFGEPGHAHVRPATAGGR